jgi:signal peptide peptidase SppA
MKPHRFRYLSALLNAPQLIDPRAAAAVLAALRPDARLQGWGGEPACETRSERAFQVVDGVALVPVVGELVHRAGGMQAQSGLCSYQGLADMLACALADPAVSAIVLDIDSPGGQAAGCLELSERIRAARGQKPLIASVNTMACSAAYALASACDRVVISRDGLAGSIGVLAYHTDISQALDEAGIVVTYFAAGAHKLDGVSEQPLTDQARAEFQAQVDAVYRRFCEVVAANRGLTVDAVRATEARVFSADQAVALGLVDAIASQEEIIMSTTSTTAPVGSRLAMPPGAATPPGPDGPPSAPEAAAASLALAEACQAAGFPELTACFLRAGLALPAAQARLAEAKAILAAGTTLRQPALARELIAEGVSEAAARRILNQAAAGADQAIVTDTTRTNPADLQPGASWSSVVAKLKK